MLDYQTVSPQKIFANITKPLQSKTNILTNATMTKILATTNLGNFTIELEEEKAPLTCENFLSYVRE
jgi:hypothetical protein